MQTDIKNNFIKEKLRNICLEDIKEQTETMLERQRFYSAKCGSCSCSHTACSGCGDCGSSCGGGCKYSNK